MALCRLARIKIKKVIRGWIMLELIRTCVNLVVTNVTCGIGVSTQRSCVLMNVNSGIFLLLMCLDRTKHTSNKLCLASPVCSLRNHDISFKTSDEKRLLFLFVALEQQVCAWVRVCVYVCACVCACVCWRQTEVDMATRQAYFHLGMTEFIFHNDCAGEDPHERSFRHLLFFLRMRTLSVGTQNIHLSFVSHSPPSYLTPPV